MRLRFYSLAGLYPSAWHDGNLGLEHRGRYLVHAEWHLGGRDLEIACRIGGTAAMVGGRAYKTVTGVLKVPWLASVYCSVCLPAWVATRCLTERTLGIEWNRYGLWWDIWIPAHLHRRYAAWRKGRGMQRQRRRALRKSPHG
jgi:hypothetical protein